jgi:hypothetical protein
LIQHIEIEVLAKVPVCHLGMAFGHTYELNIAKEEERIYD